MVLYVEDDAACVQVMSAALGTALAAYLVVESTLPLHAYTLLCCVLAAAVWLIGDARRRSTAP